MRATIPSLASLSLLFLAPSFAPLLPSEDEPYEEDITYLLDTFEEKAGKVLKQKKIDREDPKVLAQGIDPAIARAVEVLEDGIPKKAVSYVPPARR